MGTRADFYVGRGLEAEWIGSIAWDGYPEGINSPVLSAPDEAAYRAAVSEFFVGREDVTLPAQGWPWPWENSHTTDYAYAFDNDAVWACNFGHCWWKATSEPPDDQPDDQQTIFPDMTRRQNVTFGKRSGVLIVGSGGLVDGLP